MESGIVGYNTGAVTKSKYVALGIQFTGVNAANRTIAIKDLLTVDTPWGRPTIANTADQIHLWTGMAWKKYFYNSNINSWSESGQTTETIDTVQNGDTVFFLRSSRGNGTLTLSGGVNQLNAEVAYSLTKSKYHFVCYLWPVPFAVKDFKDCIDTPWGRPTIANTADQIHRWTGMAWKKYFYSSTLEGFTEDGANITEDTIDPGEGVFFLRSSRGNGTLTFTKPSGL